jgi:hypothetical protein
MRIAACEKIQQWGFDETSLDGHEVLNQWAMLVDVCRDDETKEPGCTVVTLECAGILPCSEAQSVVSHIEEVWARGKAAVEALRDCLSPELRDVLCPLTNGGVSLHKLYGVMHDTCNCANLVATLMVELRDRKCSEHYGVYVWALASAQTKACFSFLCGNHTRNLPIVRYNKVNRLLRLHIYYTQPLTLSYPVRCTTSGFKES